MPNTHFSSTVLPVEQLLEILRFLARFDLDKASISCRLLLQIVLKNASRLSRRLIDYATITNDPQRHALEPNDLKIAICALHEIDGEPEAKVVQKFPLDDKENRVQLFFAFLKHSFVRRLDVSLSMNWDMLKCIR